MTENNVHLEESIANYKRFKCGGLPSAKKFSEVGCQYNIMSVSGNEVV